jgi:hypothetical protein
MLSFSQFIIGIVVVEEVVEVVVEEVVEVVVVDVVVVVVATIKDSETDSPVSS